MKKKAYEKKILELQAELNQLQRWVKETGQRIVVLFEGRDAAGKGGVIKALTARVSPRVFKVVALPAPNDREKTQMYFQRYIQHLPAAGEIVLFDRSWYNRAGVESVMGFCSEEEVVQFLMQTPSFEKSLVNDGMFLFKYWLEVSCEEQEKRFLNRVNDPTKQWKLSDMDLESHRRWYDYSLARDRMLDATDVDHAHWHVVMSDDKRQMHVDVISHLLERIPYKKYPPGQVTLPERDQTNAYDDQASLANRRFIRKIEVEDQTESEKIPVAISAD